MFFSLPELYSQHLVKLEISLKFGIICFSMSDF